ncbi:MAG: hypothetical protein KGL99_00270 [Burkholderiales bacterium]|nr:hypothetical protein [Burkholderiales bacterium]MDE2625568.1 hypothetical protein [Burkholderiales bacterium]
MRTAISCFALTCAALLAVPALAKLPPLSEEAKAKAAAAAAKAAWAGKVDAYQLCLAMDRAAQEYRTTEKLAGKTAPPPVETPACVNPGPYVAAPAPAASGTPPAVAATAAHPKK